MSNNSFKQALLDYVKNTSDAMLITDACHKITYISKTASVMLPGLEVGSSVADIVMPLPDRADSYSEFYEYDANISYLCDDESEMYIYRLCDEAAVPMPEKDVPHAKMIEGISSKMFAPITVMFSMADAIVRDRDDADDVKHDIMVKNGYKLLKLAENISALSERNVRGSRCRCEVFELVEFIRGLIMQIEPAFRALDIRPFFDEPKRRLFVNASYNRLERVMLIIISGICSIKAQSPGSWISISVFETSTHVAVSFKYLMEKADGAENIFEHDVKDEYSIYKSSYDLAVAKVYLEQMGGSIVINTSTDGKKQITFTLEKASSRDGLFQKKPISQYSEGRFANKYIYFADILDVNCFNEKDEK